MFWPFVLLPVPLEETLAVRMYQFRPQIRVFVLLPVPLEENLAVRMYQFRPQIRHMRGIAVH